MPKVQHFESAVHQLLIALRTIAREAVSRRSQDRHQWESFIASLEFTHLDQRSLAVNWRSPWSGRSEISYDDAVFYHRGDAADRAVHHQTSGMNPTNDPISDANRLLFMDLARKMAAEAGVLNGHVSAHASCGLEPRERMAKEELFHDRWASHSDTGSIDVRHMNEACTAPEMRYITKTLGDLRGRSLLDVGCGLGEASVYFALRGAKVTATDISQGMLDHVRSLAERHGVSVELHKSATEDLHLEQGRQFDVIYLGNLLHHVDIERTIERLKVHLRNNGMFISWDPVAYNPVINMYRRMATDVRTPDEHPLTLKDLRIFRTHFSEVRTRWFWFTTLLVFMIMAVVQRRNPNKERYWKSVVVESDRWKPLYVPLELIDRALLAVFPFLRPLCWNVVVIARKPQQSSA